MYDLDKWGDESYAEPVTTGAERRGVSGEGPHSIDVDRHDAIFADRDGVIRAWGTDWADAFGYHADEALGQSLDLIVPAALQPLHWRGFTRAMRTGTLKRPAAVFRVPAVRKDGSIIPVRFVGGTLVVGDDNAVQGIKLAFVRRDPNWVGVVYRTVLRLIDGGRWIIGRLSRSRVA